MKNIKLTKKAFLASLVALVLCFAMLLGTTYAWFTDSVSSANNIIQSGNLDVELYWSTDATNWEKVDENTNVFSGELWEPGYVEVVYLKVANEGSLALKYKLGVNIESEIQGKNVAGQIFKLSDYIEFDVIEDVNTAYKDRSESLAAVDKGKAISAGYSKVNALENKGDTDYLAMVVYMPTNVGNKTNHNGINVPSINLGINLVATQFSYEEDSYGPDYDMDSLPCDVIATPDSIAEVLANAKEVLFCIQCSPALFIKNKVLVLNILLNHVFLSKFTLLMFSS
jgi:predicted ribosomally synthesized peptide with SipW-like signal peptide